MFYEIPYKIVKASGLHGIFMFWGCKALRAMLARFWVVWKKCWKKIRRIFFSVCIDCQRAYLRGRELIVLDGFAILSNAICTPVTDKGLPELESCKEVWCA